jgi:hypothetical protein
VGDELVIRLRHPLTPLQLAHLEDRFTHLAGDGRIVPTRPLAEEVADDDRLELPRIKLTFDKRRHGMLRTLIDELNDLEPAT